ncbi:tRNA (adenosine(37)-N6)-threonylcarbamoyltransferase complex dimerization subunit type 1 TsaB [Melioribacteraceae bacterium 4301-Me]|uniref:tRNA (adenosine(37)-N6)-threonylcarbamoyltransferase complex dimerization subunit type 1 TsaB n=1 Tax=Pyranulibacter aquaticus TaxID=3163344 RepID=UPI003596700F
MLPILSIETSSELCSVALMLNENTFSEINLKQKHIHSQKLITVVRQILDTFNMETRNLGSIAVSIGPGSFTGLRIGLTATKGIAFGAKLPIIPVPTFEAIAYYISKFLPDSTKYAIANTANMEEVYFGRFQKRNQMYSIVEQVHLEKKEILNDILSKDELLFGNVLHSTDDYLKANNVAEWAYLFGKDLLTYNYDYMEPFYLKKFVTRVKL